MSDKTDMGGHRTNIEDHTYPWRQLMNWPTPTDQERTQRATHEQENQDDER